MTDAPTEPATEPATEVLSPRRAPANRRLWIAIAVDVGGIVRYHGQATIYTSGSILVKNTQLCGYSAGASCTFRQLGLDQ